MNRRLLYPALLVIGLSSLTACLGEDDLVDDGDDGGSGGGLGGSGGGLGGSGGGLGGSGGGDGLSCAEMFECAGPCQDQSCVDDCLAQGSDEGTADLGDLEDCLAQFQCIDMEGNLSPSCARVNCELEYGACGIAVGDLVCLDLFYCLNTCPDQSCFDDCAARSTQGSVALLGALDECAQAAGCYDAQDFVGCLQANCVNEANACIQDGQ